MAFSFGGSSGGFGQPQSNPFSFGSGSTPTFGASGTPPASPFGASSTPAFGASTPSFGGFGASSSGGFGAASPASPFGAPSSNAFSFGASPSPFGAPSSAPSLFGASSAAFGAPAASGGLFGQAQPQAQQQQQLTLFGQPQQQLQQYHPQQVHPHQQQAVVAYGNELSSGVAPATQEVLGLMHSWTPGAPQYQRFVGLLLQALPPGYELEQVPKPPEIDSLQWRDAKEQCMRLSHLERLMPVPVLGFQGLLQRKEAQDLALKEQQERLQNAAGIAETLKRQHKVVAQEGLARIKQQHQDLAFRLIKVQRHVDALLGHVAVELGQKDPREGAVVEQLGAMLGQAESILGPGEAAGLARRVGALAAAASLRAGAGSAQPRLNRIEQHSLEEMKVSIREQVQAIQKLQDIMTAQGRDLAVLQEQLALRRRP